VKHEIPLVDVAWKVRIMRFTPEEPWFWHATGENSGLDTIFPTKGSYKTKGAAKNAWARFAHKNGWPKWRVVE